MSGVAKAAGRSRRELMANQEVSGVAQRPQAGSISPAGRSRRELMANQKGERAKARPAPSRRSPPRPPSAALADASHLYEVERRACHAERPGFRIAELQIGPRQQVPWHYHTRIQDTFYVLQGRLRLFLREPKEEVRLEPSQSYAVRPGRPHLVTNGGDASAVFLVLQGIGEYDYVPLTKPRAERPPGKRR